MNECEFGICQICDEIKPLTRTYFHYDIKCECHSPNHFDLVIHCENCIPEKPKETRVILSTKVLKEVLYGGGDPRD